MGGRATVVTMSTVLPEPIEWLWPDVIPRGKLVVVEGDPGTGKSTMSLDLAARLSVGADWPDRSPSTPGAVLLLSAEDGLADTVSPRLTAAGADLDMIHAITKVPLFAKNGTANGDGPPSLPRDIAILTKAVHQFEAEMVIIDPLNAYLGSGVDSYKDQDVRRVLHPLSELADESGCTFLLVRHLNKGSGTNALYRAGGSIGIGAASRAEFLVARDPSDPELRVFAPVKFNLAPTPPTLAYRLVDDAEFGCATVEWERGPVGLTADQLLSPPPSGGHAQKARAIDDWLKDLLSNGPMTKVEVDDEAEEMGYSGGQLDRAKDRLQIDPWKEKKKYGKWIWELPEDAGAE